MKKSSLLKQFNYSIPSSALVLTGMKQNHIAAEHLPLMNVAIDFENGILKLEGDWPFMIASNKHNEASWFGHHRERVKIETTIYPAFAIDLNDPESDGLVFPLEGNIKDGNQPGSCSGLLVIDNVRRNNGLIGNHWNISFYLYDAQFDDCEIKFKLPLYQTLFNENNN
ncbi:MAG: hypothetical protein ABI675_12835 [Chitinophagaceae bacterium]